MEPQSCIECGAVYRKVDEAMQQASEGRSSQFPRSSVSAQLSAGRGSVRRPAAVDVHSFAEQMRGESLYPFWRKLVGLATAMGYLVAVMGLIAALITMANGSVTAGLVGIGAAIFLAIMVRVGKEVSLMLSDLSDASVRVAARSEIERP